VSRVAKSPIVIPSGVEVAIGGQKISVNGPKGRLELALHHNVSVEEENGILRVSPNSTAGDGWVMAGTTRALLNNMVHGVASGFQRKLELVGVGYRAQVQGRKLNLSLGYSHPIDFPIPEGIDVATPSPSEILIAGADKQRVGQVAAIIRSMRPPEPYKGKGIRYSGEAIIRKETKKTKKK
jgi:large subunit ribosomal protein L6